MWGRIVLRTVLLYTHFFKTQIRDQCRFKILLSAEPHIWGDVSHVLNNYEVQER